MTELVVREDQPRELAPASRIQSAAYDMRAAAHIAEGVVNTMFAPAHFKGKVAEAAAAIMYGDTIGMDPMTALQNIHVISGRPGLYARAMVAVVQSKGHEVWTEEAGPTKVVVCGRRKNSDHIERAEWTVERARKAGYFTNKKYETDPESMLYARASGDVSRRVAPDALLGMAYSIEELELEETNAPEQVTSRSSVSRLRSAIASPTQEAEVKDAVLADEPETVDASPDQEPETVVADPEPEPDWAAIEAEQEAERAAAEASNVPPANDADPMTRPQMQTIQARLTELGARSSDKKHGVVTVILGRPIATMNAVSKDEASRLIDVLNPMTTDSFRTSFAAVLA